MLFKLSRTQLALAIVAVAVAGAYGAYLLAPDQDNTVPIAEILPSGIAVHDGTKPKPVVVQCDRKPTAGDSPSEDLVFVLANPMDVPIRYVGFTPDSYSPRPGRGEINPLNNLEFEDQGHWVPRMRGICGTGVATLSIRPGEAGRFRVNLPVPHEAARVGIGCAWSDEDGVESTVVIWAPDIPATP